MATTGLKHNPIKDIDSANDQPLGFLDLPTELRLEIYDIFLANFSNLKAMEPTTRKEVTNAAAILYTCKTVFNEAGESFMKYECRIYTVMLRWSSEELREWRRCESEMSASNNRLRRVSWLNEGQMLRSKDRGFSYTQRARFGRVMKAIRGDSKK